VSEILQLASVLASDGSWWEPGTPNLLDVGDMSAMLGLLVAFSGVVFGIVRWFTRGIREIVREEIQEATQPIHPDSNGGLSLADVARKTDRLEGTVEAILVHQGETRDLLLRVLAHRLDDEI
jgi:hypothetical protein